MKVDFNNILRVAIDDYNTVVSAVKRAARLDEAKIHKDVIEALLSLRQDLAIIAATYTEGDPDCISVLYRDNMFEDIEA